MTSPLISSGSSPQSPTLSPPLSVRMFSNIHAQQRLIKVFDYESESTLRYKQWKGRNVFLCSGSIILGCHWRHLLGSLALTIISWLQYIILLVPFLHWHNWYFISLLLAALNAILLINVSATDPGILPRQKFKNERSASVSIIRKDATVLKSNFCKICNIWRPARARHCKYCDNCVDIFDHHCPWTGTCIGVRNYPQFFAFVLSVAVSAIIFLFSALYLLCGWLIYGAYTDAYFLRIIVITLNIFWSCTVLSLVGTLLSFHIYLIYKGQTTNEYFRLKRAAEVANPHNTPNTVTNSPSSRITSTIDVSNKQYTFMQCMLKYCVRNTGHTTSSFNSQESHQYSTAATQGQYTTGTNSQSGEGVPSDILLHRSEECRYTPTPIESPTSAQQYQYSGSGNGSGGNGGYNNIYSSSSNINSNHGTRFSALAEEAIQLTADMLLTPLFDTDDTPFPLLSPTPQSPISLAPSPPSLNNTPQRMNTRFTVYNSRSSSTSGVIGAVSSASSMVSGSGSSGGSSTSASVMSNHTIPVRSSSGFSQQLLAPIQQSPVIPAIDTPTPPESALPLHTSSVSTTAAVGSTGTHLSIGGREITHTHFYKRSNDDAPILRLSLPPTPLPTVPVVENTSNNTEDVNNLNPILTSDELALSAPSPEPYQNKQMTTSIATIVLATVAGLCWTCRIRTATTAQCIRDRYHRPPRMLPMPGYRSYMHYGYTYICCCVPVAPASRLLPLWQYEGAGDSAQQGALLQLLFQHMAEAAATSTPIEPLSSADLSV